MEGWFFQPQKIVTEFSKRHCFLESWENFSSNWPIFSLYLRFSNSIESSKTILSNFRSFLLDIIKVFNSLTVFLEYICFFYWEFTVNCFKLIKKNREFRQIGISVALVEPISFSLYKQPLYFQSVVKNVLAHHELEWMCHALYSRSQWNLHNDEVKYAIIWKKGKKCLC